MNVRATGAYGRALDALRARGPGRMVPDLTRIEALTRLLGDPQMSFRSVHVTGTNGKGSIVRMVSALLEGLGLRTGTYVSPHLQDVRERIMVGLEPIGRDEFAALHAEVEALAQLVDAAAQGAAATSDAQIDHVTFFELLTAMAYAHLADVAVDVGVIEVGLGGRWDATNVLMADVAVIGEVDLDHAILGRTPAAVAGEKVGIIKPGSHVVSAEQRPDVAEIVARAADEAGAPLTLVGRDVRLLSRQSAGTGQLVTVELAGRVLEDLELPVIGAHQARNLLAALAALEAFLGPSFDGVDEGLLRAALATIRIPGRLETVAEDPTIILDGAHNPHATRALAEAFSKDLRFRDVIVVFGSLSDKDAAGMLEALGSIASHVILTPAPSERAADLEHIRDHAAAVFVPRGVHVEVADDVGHALELARGICGPHDVVLVTGSLTTIGTARDLLLPAGPEQERRAPPLRTLIVGLDGDEVMMSEGDPAPSDDAADDDEPGPPLG